MKTDKNIILLSILAGVALWCIDAIIDYTFFYSGYGTFLEILILNVPRHEIYIRISAFILLVCIGFAFSYYIKELKQSKSQLQNVFHNVIPICITTEEYDIINTNESYDKIFGSDKKPDNSVKCYDSRPGPKCRTEDCPVVQVFFKGKELYTCESVKKNDDGTERHFIVSATPYRDPEGNKIGIIETFQEITPRKILEKEKEKLINNLREALEQVKVLSGFLPICASCKKIRDDKGYWTQIETYIRNNTEAEFSHGICPDCAEKLYGKYEK